MIDPRLCPTHSDRRRAECCPSVSPVPDVLIIGSLGFYIGDDVIMIRVVAAHAKMLRRAVR